MISAIEQAVEDAGYTLSIRQIKAGEDELAAAARLSRAKKLKGLILLGGRFDYTKEDVAPIDIPFVCCTFTNDFGTIESEAYSSVSIDDRLMARGTRGHLRLILVICGKLSLVLLHPLWIRCVGLLVVLRVRPNRQHDADDQTSGPYYEQEGRIILIEHETLNDIHDKKALRK